MKRLFVFLLCLLTVLGLLSCSKDDNCNHSNEEPLYEATPGLDWKIFSSFKEIDASSDCIIVGTVLEKGECISSGDNLEDFKNFEELRKKSPQESAFLHLSIRTPYTIRVDEIISAKDNIDIAVNDSIILTQRFGQIYNVKLNGNEEDPKIGGKFVFILAQNAFDDKVYYHTLNDSQCIAEIPNANTSNKKNFITADSTFSLFKDITSVEQIKQALK